MFTGIVEERGLIKKIESSGRGIVIEIECEKSLEDLKIGDSVAVNGICLTASKIGNNSFSADCTRETVNTSNIGSLKAWDKVNLERALKVGGRLGGHFVSGHIDGVGIIKSIKRVDLDTILTVEISEDLMQNVVKKGSIALDGVSLTVSKVLNAREFQVALIPVTLRDTGFESLKAGNKVNIETDMLAKYVRGNRVLMEEFFIEKGF